MEKETVRLVYEELEPYTRHRETFPSPDRAEVRGNQQTARDNRRFNDNSGERAEGQVEHQVEAENPLVLQGGSFAVNSCDVGFV